MLILIAKKADGKLIILSSEVSKQTLRKLRTQTKFYCPQCKELVILKVGDVVIPHFSHKQDTSCLTSFSEGESKEHLEGKEQLYSFFNRLNKKVQLEPYMNKIAQRPDLLVEMNSKKIPIEFQCSSIPIHQIKKRTNGYEKAGLKPIWLLRTPEKYQALSRTVCVFKFNKFEESFIQHKTPVGSLFLTYNPQFKQFHYFSSLIHVAGKRYIGLHRTLSVNSQTYPFAWPKTPMEKEVNLYSTKYIAMREKFLQTAVLKNRIGIKDPFLRRCYELRIIPVNLPNWIGIPVLTTSSFREHPCEWQLALIHFLKVHAIRLDDFSIAHIQKFVRLFKGSTRLQIQACIQYRDFLLTKGLASLNTQIELCDQDFNAHIAATLLAKSYEN